MKELTRSQLQKGAEHQLSFLQKELDRCLRILIEQYHPQQVWVFGSLAAGDIRPDSDIDIIVIKKTEKPFWERLVEVFYLLEPQVPVDVLVYTPSEWEEVRQRLFFKSEVLSKGKLLYEASI
ncbi:MAG: nucleotidyltransferase domain-containing protein [Chloroflexi bacterium]|nr:nucleotidyltransferase domain-containing protein [Chloroflexota bacterium]